MPKPIPKQGNRLVGAPGPQWPQTLALLPEANPSVNCFAVKELNSLGFRVQEFKLNYFPIMENQMENEMETGVI